MAHVAFDTLNFANKLKAVGVDAKIAETQAELQAEVLQEWTKNEVATQDDIHTLKTEIKEDMVRLEHKIELVEKNLVIKVGTITAAAITIIEALHYYLH